MGIPSNKLDIEYIRQEALVRWGFILISDEYKNNYTPLAWMDSKTGKTFIRAWGKLLSGKLGINNVNNYDKDKRFFESYKGLGYKLDMTVDEYLNAPTQSGNKIFHLTHPDLEEPWDVKKGHFKTLAETHLNNYGKSLGEVFIESILIENGIIFDEQKKVYINGDLNLFDFYLPEHNLYIEYDGKQHFLSIDRWGGEDGLKRRQLKDAEKDKYVREKGERMLRIPYTISDLKDIAGEIGYMLGVDLSVPQIKLTGVKQDIVDYYVTHSTKETSDKYKISANTVRRYYKQVYGHSKYRG